MIFQQQRVNISDKNSSKLIDNPVLYQSFSGNIKDSEFYIVTDIPYSPQELYSLKEYIIEVLGHRIKYSVISSLLLRISVTEIKANVVKFYTKNKVDLKKYIPPYSKIITFGRSLYAITESDDLLPEDFIDLITNKKSFFDPELKSQVFPLPYFRSFLNKDSFYSKWASSQIKDMRSFSIPRRRISPLKINVVENTSDFFKKYSYECLMSLDTETSGFNFLYDSLGCVTLSFDGKEGFYLRWKDIDIGEFNEFLSNKKLILFNAKFDCKFLLANGVKRENIFIAYDCWNLAHIWKEDNTHNSLKSTAWRLTDYGGYDRELERIKEELGVTNYLEIPEDILIQYATKDAIITFLIYEKLMELISQMDREFPLENGWSVYRYIHEIVMPAQNSFLDIEWVGSYIDKEELGILSKELLEEIDIRRKKVFDAFDLPDNYFNLDSTDALGKFILSKGWKIREWSKKKLPLTGDDQLQRWIKDGHEEAQLIFDYRSKMTLYKTFIGSEKDNSGTYQYLYYHEDDNSYRTHSSFFTMLANSGRDRSKNPNNQNYPARGENARFVRRMFTTPDVKKYGFLSADFSGFQLRIGAILSGDLEMRDAFINRGGDIHSITAQGVLKRDITLEEFLRLKKEGNEDIGEIRFKSKSINFGFLFGSSAFSFAKQVLEKEWSIEETKQYCYENELDSVVESRYRMLTGEDANIMFKDIAEKENFAYYWAAASDIRTKFFDTYFGLKSWIDETVKLARKDGFIRSYHGAFRRLPNLLYVGKDDRQSHIKNLENIALNSPVQNFESVVVHRWITKVCKSSFFKERKIIPFSAIHDAGENYVEKQSLKECSEFLYEIGNEMYPEYNEIPIVIEANFADPEKGQLWDMGEAI